MSNSAAETCSVGAFLSSEILRSSRLSAPTTGGLYEQVAVVSGLGKPAPSMSRVKFLRLLDAAEYIAAHIHEAPCGLSLSSGTGAGLGATLFEFLGLVGLADPSRLTVPAAVRQWSLFCTNWREVAPSRRAPSVSLYGLGRRS